MENVLLCGDQKMQGLHKELTEKTDETQVDLQAVKTSINMWTGTLKGNIMDTKKVFHKAIENTTNDLHKELDTMFQVEATIIKPEIKINQESTKARIEGTQHESQTQSEKVEAGAKHERGTETGAAKPPKFDMTTSWTMFRHQLEAMAEHNCWTNLEKSTYLITTL
jgi:hypothetical protein